MSNQPVRTIVNTNEGELAFQHYFVERHCEPVVKSFRFDGQEQAQPAPGVIEALAAADLVIICPSNPWVSVAPILTIAPLRAALAGKCVVAVSPIIGGKAVKGPAAKMFTELGIDPSAFAVAQYYGSLLSGLVLDEVDAGQTGAVRELGIMPAVAPTLMQTREDRARLAQVVVDFGANLLAQ
jgi:LPPG:FO 2-phospho-L-lactate transferase